MSYWRISGGQLGTRIGREGKLAAKLLKLKFSSTEFVLLHRTV